MSGPRQIGPYQACLPCAKRKVRCDRETPSCSNCKRRKGDHCLYPLTQSPAKGLTEYVPLERVKELENYIRCLGGDPDLAVGLRSAQNTPLTAVRSPVTTQQQPPISQQQTGPDLTSQVSRVSQAASESEVRPGLIVKEKRSIYVESPMWYSWSDANKHLSGQDDTTPGNDWESFDGSSGSDALLGQIYVSIEDPLYQQHPSSPNIVEIWQYYLRNVHPLTMMFFSWEKDSLIRTLAADTTKASKEEHTFLYAMYFLTVLSIDEEECNRLLGGSRSATLNHFQRLTEKTLLAAGFASTYDRLLLQAFMMYLLAMRNRARPNTLYSLGGVAVRIAERMGLHRDGSLLGLPPVESEERRRTWWQLQNLEILIALVAGCIPLSLTAAWDTRLPSNLDDSDILRDMNRLPDEKKGLTSMSVVLAQYTFLYSRRANLGTPRLGIAPLYTAGAADREREFEAVESLFRTKFLQYCEPLEPLHTYIQISVRSVLMAYRRTLDQPKVTETKLSDMSLEERNKFLKTCMKCLEYNILLFTKEEIKGFRWQAENYFQWIAFVYILLEAHQRASDPSWSKQIWDLVSRIYDAYPMFATRAGERELFKSFGKMVLGAWKPHADSLQSDSEHQEAILPWYIRELEQQLPKSQPMAGNGVGLGTTEATDAATAEETLAAYHTTNEHCLGFVGGWDPGAGDELWDLNMIDWSFWESSNGRMF